MYVLVVEDSSRLTEVVGLAMLSVEDAPAIDWMLQCSKENNIANSKWGW